MIVLGVTGSMASGKSSLTHRIRQVLKWPIWDADAEVQKLYQNTKVIHDIGRLFPMAQTRQGLDRQKLRQAIIQDSSWLRKLESILYPPLSENRQQFLHQMQGLRIPIIVLDIPLLFEKNLQSICDTIVVVTCPDWLQRQRILKRAGMTESLMNRLLASQLSQTEKQKRADIIIDSGLNHHHTWTQFMTLVVRKLR